MLTFQVTASMFFAFGMANALTKVLIKTGQHFTRGKLTVLKHTDIPSAFFLKCLRSQKAYDTMI
jgi:fucose permease